MKEACMSATPSKLRFVAPVLLVSDLARYILGFVQPNDPA